MNIVSEHKNPTKLITDLVLIRDFNRQSYTITTYTSLANISHNSQEYPEEIAEIHDTNFALIKKIQLTGSIALNKCVIKEAPLHIASSPV